MSMNFNGQNIPSVYMYSLTKTIAHFESLQKRYKTQHNDRMCERVYDALQALYFCRDYLYPNGDGRKVENKSTAEIETAIEALKKQIPKKMETKKCVCYDGEEQEYEVCANCGTQVRFAGTMTAKYCWNCGQRVL
mgnify:CR=1 FL=1